MGMILPVPVSLNLELGHPRLSMSTCKGMVLCLGETDDMDIEERQHSGSKAGPSGRPAGHAGQNGQHAGSTAGARRQQSGSLPMLASACPGWVCYAEKTHGDIIVPYISTTRSPQVTTLRSTCLALSQLHILGKSHNFTS